MADRGSAYFSFNPLVQLTDDDAGNVFGYHHDMNTSMAGDYSYTFSSGDRWYYSPGITIRQASNGILTTNTGSYTQAEHFGSGGYYDGYLWSGGYASTVRFTDSASDGAIVTGDEDTCKFIYIKNLGYSVAGTGDANALLRSNARDHDTTNSIYFGWDGDAVAYNSANAVEIAPGEAWCGSLNTLVHKLTACIGQPDGAGDVANTETVVVEVVAIINDGA